jgi:hypothetical protein
MACAMTICVRLLGAKDSTCFRVVRGHSYRGHDSFFPIGIFL